MEKKIDLSQASFEDLEAALERKRQIEKWQEQQRRDAYESIRAQVVHSIMIKVKQVTADVEALHSFVREETDGFKAVMEEYSHLRDPGQMSFRIRGEDYRIDVENKMVKRFDERADVAASRLVEFMRKWIRTAPGGVDNPMYQLAMVLLERNKQGDLDYKNISKLYSLETKFDNEEYSEIMKLFKESHLVDATATKFYFWERDKHGVWRRIEPSFNRL